jgi:hypothetical protein
MDLFLVALAVIGLHVLCLCFNALVAQYILRLDRPEVVSITIMASQVSSQVNTGVSDRERAHWF